MNQLRFALIGCGHWGPNYARLLQAHPQTRLEWASDLQSQRLDQLVKRYPHLRTTPDSAHLLEQDLDAVIIASPASSHYALCKSALERGLHVLCEKPLTLKTSESQELCDLAQAQNRQLMVGHTFLFNSGILELKKYLESGLLGELYYMTSQRTNLGPIRQDVNAIADLATHDISILNYLLQGMPDAVSAQGQSFLQNDVADLAFLTLKYQQVMAHIHVSWLHPVKERRMTLVGSKKMVVWDDMNAFEPIRIYDAEVKQEPYYQDFGQFQLLPKHGDTLIPRLQLQEPLKAVLDEFVSCLQEKRPSYSDGPFARGVVQTLEALQHSLKHQGQSVTLSR